MKILIAADKSRFFYLKQFADALNKQKIECNLVYDLDIYDKLANKKYIRWLSKPEKFQKIITEFKPDVVFTERENRSVKVAPWPSPRLWTASPPPNCLAAMALECSPKPWPSFLVVNP